MAEEEKVETAREENMFEAATALVGCFLGLQISYLTWGIMQEQTMKHPYANAVPGSSTGKMFPSAVFLVASNRVVALLLSAAIVWYRLKTGMQEAAMAPLWKFAPHSLSNVVSAFAQYEALKYVSFPTQTLSKSCKVIPVMLVGRGVHNKTYKRAEYIEAVFITAGSALFFLNEKKGPVSDNTDSFLGVGLLALYLMCDSFTSQWQSKVYDSHQIDQFQMMMGTNAVSIIFTGVSLVYSAKGTETLHFLALNPDAARHVLITSLTGAVGQIFIFWTIKRFGPLVFTIIMTTRQIFSIVLSCLIYGHQIGSSSLLGCAVVFGSVCHQIHRKVRAKKKKEDEAKDNGKEETVPLTRVPSGVNISIRGAAPGANSLGRDGSVANSPTARGGDVPELSSDERWVWDSK